jgi:hypothetical protein
LPFRVSGVQRLAHRAQRVAEEGVANRLVDQGVPKSDIALAFQSPYKRQFSDFATR